VLCELEMGSHAKLNVARVGMPALREKASVSTSRDHRELKASNRDLMMKLRREDPMPNPQQLKLKEQRCFGDALSNHFPSIGLDGMR